MAVGLNSLALAAEHYDQPKSLTEFLGEYKIEISPHKMTNTILRAMPEVYRSRSRPTRRPAVEG